MMFVRREPEQFSAEDTAPEACDRSITSLRAKADRYAFLSRAATTTVVGIGAVIPVCIIVSTQGNRFWWGQLLPGLLGVLSAIIAGILQFEKPHERWRFYRGYQRTLETERLRFTNRSGPYQGLDDAQAELALTEFLVRVQQEHHRQWETLVPPSGEVAGSAGQGRDPAGSSGG